ncbi:hypothetical protein AB0L44_35720 [Nonomuraea wenchangensis]|uniref:hypothetical protein n=1 Tax=Nonomuraea wenchangensis TaxID=568860 RepID=UPI0034350F88
MDVDEWPWRGELWRFCGANGFYGPEHILVRVFPGKGRRTFEKRLLALVGDDMVLGEPGHGYLIVRGRCEGRVRAGFGVWGHRLDVRRLPPRLPGDEGPGEGAEQAVEWLLERCRRYGYGPLDEVRDQLVAAAEWFGGNIVGRITVGTMPGMRECEDVLGPRRWMKQEYRRRRRRAKGAGSPA